MFTYFLTFIGAVVVWFVGLFAVCLLAMHIWPDEFGGVDALLVSARVYFVLTGFLVLAWSVGLF